jgi:hypothetical protein
MSGAAQAQTVGAGGTPPIPPQQARIWVYREASPSALPTVPLVRFNGVIAGAIYQGGALYRDVAPGHYHVTVDSIGVDVNQSSDFNLAPGQEAYIQIQQLDNWDETPYEPSYATYYAWLRPPEMARPVVWRSYNYGGGPLTGAWR